MASAMRKLLTSVTTLYTSLTKIRDSSLFTSAQPPDFLILPIPPGEVMPKHLAIAASKSENPTFTQTQALTVVANLTEYFNNQLVDGAKAFAANGTLGRVITWDVPGTWYDAVGNPGNFGLKVVNTGCLGSGNVVCSDPSEYLFWDDFHPPTNIHQRVAKSVTDLILKL